MTTVKVSPKYQIVIPKAVREQLGLRVGATLQVFLYDGRIEVIPVKDIRKMRGFLKGMDTTIDRDEEDRV